MKNILIVRNDKIGDFILAYPAFALLKSSLPNVKISVIVPQYTYEAAQACEFIDNVIIDPGASAGYLKQFHLLKTLRDKNFDAVITLFSTTRIGLLLLLSGIKYRLAPATKLAQVFYNHKLVQRRSKSLKPEYEYNLDLVKKFLTDLNMPVKETPQAPFLYFNENEVSNVREDFCKKHNIKNDAKLIFIHPGTGGSATNLSFEQYATLIKNLSSHYTIVITAGPSELNNAKQLSKLINNISHVIYYSTDGIISFSKHIQFCDLFISASTGPLHIAGALDRPTAAFYQRRRSATALRWQTLNSEQNRLAFSPPDSADESDLRSIDVIKAAELINETYL